MTLGRPMGTEREVALGARGASLTAKEVFERVEQALLQGRRSGKALYYKGGRFLGDGSLLHFEVSQIEDADQGLLEWASPECLGAREAALYFEGQEESLLEARRLAIEASEEPFEPILLSSTQDRAKNAFGCHESYEVEDRARGWRAWLATWVLHPLVLLVLGLGLVAFFVPLFAVLTVGLFLYGVFALPATIPTLGAPFDAGARALASLGQYLVEPGPGPFQGLAARILVVFARAGGWLFSLSARWALFSRHRPALLPFLAVRPLIAGVGHLDERGRFRLTPRAEITDRTVAAFVIGTKRPMIDVKALYFRAPWEYVRRRQRLHVVCSDATRCPLAGWLRLALTELVLDAAEEDRLGGLVAGLELEGGPLELFRRAAHPDLRAPVARFAGKPLTAIGVQRLYLEALREYAALRASEGRPLRTDQAEALGAWGELLDDLQAEPARALDRVDWVRKLALLEDELRGAWPERAVEASWLELLRWGELQERIEELAPSWSGGDAESLVAALGARRGRAFVRRVEAIGSFREWDEARRTWLALKTIDLAYHELSPESPYTHGPAPRAVFSAAERHEARHQAPRTRARVRARALELGQEHGAAVELGWERIRVPGTPGFDLSLEDVLEDELAPEDEAALAAALRGASDAALDVITQ